MAMRSRRILALVIFVAAGAWLWMAGATTGAGQAEPAGAPASAWGSLPAETVGGLSLVDPGAFVGALRERTKAGKLFFDAERVEKIKATWQAEAPQAWEEMVKGLEKYGLTVDDLPQLISGPAGLGVVAGQREGQKPYWVMLAWLQPGEELAVRGMEAVQKMAEQAMEEKDSAISRVDLTLSGVAVMHLSLPDMEMDQEFDYSVPDNFADMSEEEREQFFEAKRQEAQNAKKQIVDVAHLMIGRLGPRVVVGLSFPQSRAEVKAAREGGKALDWDALTGTATLEAILAEFLKQQQTEGDGGFVRRVGATAGLAEVMPAGVPLVEAVIDAGAIVGSLRATLGEGFGAGCEAFGLGQLGVMAMRSTLDGTVLRSGSILQAPVPRQGLLQLLDQPLVPGDPPAWASSAMMGFSQFSFDLGKAYVLVRDLLAAQFGENVLTGCAMAEAQFQQTFQSDIATVLSSLGARHSFLSYAPRVVEVKMPHWERDEAGEPVESEKTIKMPQQRFALVWQVSDEAIWQKGLQAIAAFAPQTEGALQYAEEQGFNGWRLQAPGQDMSVFQGSGYLVLTVGPEVTEEVLSALRSPPAGEGALAGHPRMQRARELVPLSASVGWQVVDTGANMAETSRVVQTYMGSFMEEAADEPAAEVSEEARVARAIMAVIKDWLKEEDLKGAFGVSVTNAAVTAQGMTSRAATELTPVD
ncbi:MAG: hypothetical protein IT443_07575 [Phycisphaeraceae bacterium]|nr:hypothetical protein [Phycisphaeraceae bacterium]